MALTERRDFSRAWLVVACVLSLALILGAPFLGQLRAILRTASGGNFVPLMAAIVAGGAAFGIVCALIRIRRSRTSSLAAHDRPGRGFRYAALLAALAVGVGYAMASSTGNPEVDAVERFHFIQYGLITLLFYRAWKPSGDGSLLVMPLIAGLLVGTLEEWLQWFIPARVGEVRDILLNFIAIGCGLLFSLGLDPPPRLTVALTTPSRRRVSLLSAFTVIVFGCFFHSVHLGYEIKDSEAGVFRSRYTAGELAALAAERSARWSTNPPLTWSRLSREDQYFSEGVMHIQQRNETWQEGNVLASRHENLILEKYYAPVLDTPSYLSAHGHRWAPSQRADAEARIGAGFMIYVSEANDYPIVIWPTWLFWLAITTLAGVCLRGLRFAA